MPPNINNNNNITFNNNISHGSVRKQERFVRLELGQMGIAEDRLVDEQKEET